MAAEGGLCPYQPGSAGGRFRGEQHCRGRRLVWETGIRPPYLNRAWFLAGNGDAADDSPKTRVHRHRYRRESAPCVRRGRATPERLVPQPAVTSASVLLSTVVCRLSTFRSP